jgi:hypothetical protein
MRHAGHRLSVTLWLLLGGCGAVRLDAIELPPDKLVTGLVAHWALDDGAGAVARDQSGNGRDGQLAGGTWIADGRFMGGLRFAAGDSITVPNFPAASADWTLSTWIRLSAEQLANDGEMWVSILSVENFFEGGWQLNIDNRLPRPRLDFAYWAPPLMAYAFTECECVGVDHWTHLVAVVDANTNRVTLYVDTTVGDQETRPSDIPAGDSTLYIGRWNRDGRLFSGDLDDIAIWNRALTAAEVAILFSRSPTAPAH